MKQFTQLVNVFTLNVYNYVCIKDSSGSNGDGGSGEGCAANGGR